MLKRVLFVLLTPVLVFAGDGSDGKLVDKTSGLEVKLPDGWKRRSDMESGSRPLVAVYAVEDGAYVQFVAEIGSSDNYDADAWVTQQKTALGNLFEKLDNPLAIQERKLGGLDAVGFVLSGSKGDKAVRARIYHVVRNGIFFQFTEVSFNDAHTQAGAKPIDGMWEGIAFGEATESIPLQEGADAASKEARLVEDKLGNFKLTMPAGWELESAPPIEAKSNPRLVLVRRDSNGNPVAFFNVLRWEARSASIFTEWTPGDAILNLVKESKGLEYVYGQKSSPHLTPNIDESAKLGDADKVGKWRISSITMENKAKRREAETRKRRGEKGVEIPEFKPFITIGRTAMISPYIYHAYATVAPRVSEDKALAAEIEKILDSFEFLKTKALPPAMTVGPVVPGNTVAAAEYAEERKHTTLYTETGRKVYKLEIDMLLPPGFRLLTKEETGGGNVSAMVVAQDENNNWAKIQIMNVSAKKAGDEQKVLGDKKEYFATWKSNWESKARGDKAPEKPKKVSWGKARGQGYKLLEGEIQGWPATFTGIVFDKSSWRTIITVETQGQNSKRFEKELDDFFKKLKFNYKVK